MENSLHIEQCLEHNEKFIFGDTVGEIGENSLDSFLGLLGAEISDVLSG